MLPVHGVSELDTTEATERQPPPIFLLAKLVILTLPPTPPS